MSETPDERRRRLTRQAENMRAARAQKKLESHVCPPSETDAQLNRVKWILSELGSGNIAQLPLAMAEDSEGKWTVDIHVKIRRVMEFEVTGEGETLADALAHAYTSLVYEFDGRSRGTPRQTPAYAYRAVEAARA